MVVGSLNWLITLGRYDVYHASVTLARYMMIPREEHMKAMQNVFGHLKSYPKFSIKFDTNMADHSVHASCIMKNKEFKSTAHAPYLYIQHSY